MDKSKDPSAADVFVAAIAMEQSGIDLYQALSVRADRRDVREFCEQAAAEESRHQQVLRGLQRRLPEDAPPASPQTAQRLHDLACKLIQPGPEAVGKVVDQGTVGEALAMAVQMEQASILFYGQLQDVYPTQAAVLQSIIEQERLHLERFQELAR